MIHLEDLRSTSHKTIDEMRQGEVFMHGKSIYMVVKNTIDGRKDYGRYKEYYIIDLNHGKIEDFSYSEGPFEMVDLKVEVLTKNAKEF